MDYSLDLNLFPNVAVIDVEASGLGPGTWPIEIGWAYGDLRTESFLVRPHAAWEMDAWSSAAAQVHGITIDDCWEQGLDPEEVASRMNRAFAGMRLLSDDPEQDNAWISRLFTDSGLEQTFEIEDYEGMLTLLASQVLGRDYYRIERSIPEFFPYTHRAAEDARNRMAMLCACRHPELLDVWAARRDYGM